MLFRLLFILFHVFLSLGRRYGLCTPSFSSHLQGVSTFCFTYGIISSVADCSTVDDHWFRTEELQVCTNFLFFSGEKNTVCDILHCKREMVKFDYRISAEILIFQLVNFDYFVVKNDHSLVTLNYSMSHLQLTIKIVKFDLSLLAEILIFQLVNFDYF